MKLDLYSQTGEKSGQVEVSDAYFDAPYNRDLIHQALLRQLTNARSPIAHTLTKDEVRGGGRKPYAQKSTGNARQGSTRNPQWKGGGVAFGPRNVRNYTVAMPKKQRRAALFSALTVKAQNNQIFALDKYDTKEIKTKLFAQMIEKLPVEKDLLVVIPEKNRIVQKSSKNIPFVKTILVNYLNIADLQKYEKVMFLKESFEKMELMYKEHKASEAPAKEKASAIKAAKKTAKAAKTKAKTKVKAKSE